MMSLLEMISGWVMVVLFAVSVLYPLGLILQKLVGLYLKSASDGRIKEVKVLPWFSKELTHKYSSRYGWEQKGGYTFLVTTFSICQFFFWLIVALVSFDHTKTANIHVHAYNLQDFSVNIFNFWYSVGEFLALPLTIAAILYGFHKVLRLVFKLQLLASNALQAVKDHENNMHKGE